MGVQGVVISVTCERTSSAFWQFSINLIMQIDKQISEDWLASNEFLINEEVITILDYYIVTTCTDKPISEVE